MSAPIIVTLCATVAVITAIGAAACRHLQRGAARRRVFVGVRRSRHSGATRMVRLVERRRLTRVGRPSAALVAEVLDQTARRCSSGESLGESLIAASARSPLHALFAPVAAAMHTGESVEVALGRLPTDRADVGLAVHVLRLCAQQGGNVSESLDRAAATLRERETVTQERLAQSSQARLSARVLTVLPLAFGGWTALTTPTVRRFFLTPIGALCLALGLGLNVTGWVLMRRLTRGLT